MMMILPQQPIAEFAADDVADHLPDDGCGRRGEHDRDDVEIVLGAGKNRGDDEHRLAGEGKADALKANDAGDHDKAVVMNEMGD